MVVNTEDVWIYQIEYKYDSSILNILKRFNKYSPNNKPLVEWMNKGIECMICYDKIKQNIVNPCKFNHYYCEGCLPRLDMICPCCTTPFTQLIIYNPFQVGEFKRI